MSFTSIPPSLSCRGPYLSLLPRLERRERTGLPQLPTPLFPGPSGLDLSPAVSICPLATSGRRMGEDSFFLIGVIYDCLAVPERAASVRIQGFTLPLVFFLLPS